jgi:hypothetical protein
MAKVNIRGIGKVSLARDAAVELQSFKNDTKYFPNDKFTQFGLDIEKRDIGGIVLDDFEEDDKEASSSRKDKNAEYYREESIKFRKHVEHRCKMDWREKAKDISPFEAIFAYGTMTEEIRAEIVRRQMEMYEQKPRAPRVIVPIKDLLPRQTKGKEYHVAGILPSRMLDIVYRSFYSEIGEAKELGYVARES